MYYTEGDPDDALVIRKVVAIYDDHYETFAYVNGHWYTKLDISSPVDFQVMPWMRRTPCPS
jgi:hypothetical protein